VQRAGQRGTGIAKTVGREASRVAGGGALFDGPLGSAMGGRLRSMMGGRMGHLASAGIASLVSGNRNSFSNLRNKAEGKVGALSPLRSNQQSWSDLIEVLTVLSDIKTEELNSALVALQLSNYEAVTATVTKAIGELAPELMKSIRVDEDLYNSISRQLRAEMRMERERFGRLRDGMR
jgi:hypothetical protein